MKMKLGIAAILLAAFPTLTLAGAGCSSGDHKQAMSCAEGLIWDSASQSCIEQASS